MLELSDEAVALWVRAGSYCAGHLTDGTVKRSTLRVLGASNDAATELVLAGLWDHGDGSWSFHDWEEYQPTREQVEAEREKARERMRHVRANKERTSPSSSPSPSRPVPSRPDQVTTVSQSSYVPEREQPVDNVSRATLGSFGLDADGLRTLIHEHTGRTVTPAGALRVAMWLLDKGRNVKQPGAYVNKAIKGSPFEVQQYIDEEGL